MGSSRFLSSAGWWEDVGMGTGSKGGRACNASSLVSLCAWKPNRSISQPANAKYIQIAWVCRWAGVPKIQNQCSLLTCLGISFKSRGFRRFEHGSTALAELCANQPWHRRHLKLHKSMSFENIRFGTKSSFLDGGYGWVKGSGSGQGLWEDNFIIVYN